MPYHATRQEVGAVALALAKQLQLLQRIDSLRHCISLRVLQIFVKAAGLDVINFAIISAIVATVVSAIVSPIVSSVDSVTGSTSRSRLVPHPRGCQITTHRIHHLATLLPRHCWMHTQISARRQPQTQK